MATLTVTFYFSAKTNSFRAYSPILSSLLLVPGLVGSGVTGSVTTGSVSVPVAA